MNRFLAIIIGLSAALAACNTSDHAAPQPLVIENVAPLETGEFKRLSPAQQYAVINNLLATLYQGVPVQQFFKLTQGIRQPSVLRDAPNPDLIRKALATPLPDIAPYLAEANAYTYFTEAAPTADTRYYSTQPLVLPQAVLFELPLSRDSYHRWMAYVLMNSILFSPALELDSVRSPAVAAIYERLVRMMDEGRTMRDIAYEHMISPQNWERFRSPEDNTREMMEIFLARFIDAEVPPAATACKNWSVVYDANGVSRIARGANANTEPQQLLGTSVVTCEDFYRALANHVDLIPTLATVLVNQFFNNATMETKGRLMASIVAENPQTFDALFSLILFSRAYLLGTARARSAEESFFGLAHRLGWTPAANFFDTFTDVRNPGSASVTLLRMGQGSMLYKLGRSPRVPTDTLNFSLHHKLVRELLLLNRLDSATDGNGGWAVATLLDDPAVAALSGDDFIDYLFFSVVLRPARPAELATLNQIILARSYTTNRVAQAMLVFEYLARLPELYSMREARQVTP
jgi:hypothetical protein